MLIDELINDFRSRFGDKPAMDQSQLKVWLSSFIQKLDLVSREEFDAQARVLARAQAHIHDLEERISTLEQATNK
ncbi:MAG: accessory factor UbiK family protein [Pseudomonadota bacterium]